MRWLKGRGGLHSQKEGLSDWQGPSTLNKLCGSDVGTCNAQRHELASEQAEYESLRPNASKPSPKTLEKHRRRVELDFRSRVLLHGYGPSSGIDLILGLA